MAKQSGKSRKSKIAKSSSSKKATAKKTVSSTAAAKPAPPPPVIPEILKRINGRHFWYTFGVLAIITMVLALQSGINGDDLYQVDYSEKLLDYYGTMGQDTAALFVEKGNMHLYGGFFEVVAGTTNKVLQRDPLSWCLLL